MSDDEETPPDSGPEDDTAPGIAREDADWTVEREVADDERVSVGDTVRFAKTVTGEEVAGFADASGDTNRLHVDAEFAEGTRFGGPIVHGALVTGLVSAAVARLPGVVVYLGQDSEFHAPVRPGERPVAEVAVVEALGEDRYRVATTVEADAGVAIDGEATVLVDPLPGAD
jgi:3-hydroxybutyryl-CoA dehydratase